MAKFHVTSRSIWLNLCERVFFYSCIKGLDIFVYSCFNSTLVGDDMFNK